MIIEQTIYRENEAPLIKRFSDQDFFLLQDQTGILYLEAVDLFNAPWTYTETDMPIEKGNPEDI